MFWSHRVVYPGEPVLPVDSAVLPVVQFHEELCSPSKVKDQSDEILPEKGGYLSSAQPTTGSSGCSSESESEDQSPPGGAAEDSSGWYVQSVTAPAESSRKGPSFLLVLWSLLRDLKLSPSPSAAAAGLVVSAVLFFGERFSRAWQVLLTERHPPPVSHDRLCSGRGNPDLVSETIGDLSDGAKKRGTF